MDCHVSKCESQNFMKELAQSDLLFLSYDSGCITTQNFLRLKILYQF